MVFCYASNVFIGDDREKDGKKKKKKEGKIGEFVCLVGQNIDCILIL
jgi:hypothetical protein